MTFVQSVKTCFNKFVTASGRASRSEFWWFALSCVFTMGWLFFGTIPLLFAGIRLLHDAGHSGWWIFCPIMRIIFLIQESQEDDNKWCGRPAE